MQYYAVHKATATDFATFDKMQHQKTFARTQVAEGPPCFFVGQCLQLL